MKMCHFFQKFRFVLSVKSTIESYESAHETFLEYTQMDASTNIG